MGQIRRQAQGRRRPLRRRQGIQRRPHVGACIGAGARILLDLGRFGQRAFAQATAAVAAPTGHGLAPGDAAQPDPQAGFAAKRVDAPKGGQEGLLRQVLRQGGVPAQPAQEGALDGLMDRIAREQDALGR